MVPHMAGEVPRSLVLFFSDAILILFFAIFLIIAIIIAVYTIYYMAFLKKATGTYDLVAMAGGTPIFVRRGTPLRCPYCGAPVAPGWRYCPSCGHEIGAEGRESWPSHRQE